MYCSDFLSPIKWQYRAQPGSQFELPSDGHCVGNNYFIWCHNDARLEPHFKDVKKKTKFIFTFRWLKVFLFISSQPMMI